MRVTFSILLVISCAFPIRAQSIAADTSRTAFIRSNSGTHYWGEILRETSDSVFLLQGDGVLVDLPRSAIDVIKYGMTKPRDPFWEGGLVFGSPGGINFLAGYQWEFGGVRVSGDYFSSDVAGIQINASYKLYRGESASHYVSFVWSYSTTAIVTGGDQPQTFRVNGLGAAYDLNFVGISFELGLLQNFTTNNREILLQLGYVYQFR